MAQVINNKVILSNYERLLINATIIGMVLVCVGVYILVALVSGSA